MILQTEAVVLHRMKYKNSSLIARIFTKDFGKMSIIMNGVGKQKGNVFGIIEPPNIIKLNYYQRKQGSLQTCKEVHFLHHTPLIKKDILKLGVALSIVEIVDKTFHECDGNANVYHLINDTLKIVNDTTYDSRIVLCFFLLKIIEALGFMLDMSNENSVMVSMNQEIKLFLQSLNKHSIHNINDVKQNNINLIEPIIFFENYIKQHLKLSKDIQSFKMLKEMAYG